VGRQSAIHTVNFFNAMIQKLDDLHENNQKMSWETIDKLKGKTIKQNPISISDWHKYMSWEICAFFYQDF
jgi:hypothetical protein